MYFSTTLLVFSAVALSSAIPTQLPYTRLFPRDNATEICKDGSPVDGPGEKLNAEAAAESHQIDNTAEFGLRAVSIKTSGGDCLTIKACGGDFRQNLIPLQIKPCRASTDPNIARQKFDVIKRGKHSQQDDKMLIVSSLTHGCLNSDARKDAANLFSCGGRADGDGKETDSQTFDLVDNGQPAPLRLKKTSGDITCLAVDGGKIVASQCINEDPSQQFTLG